MSSVVIIGDVAGRQEVYINGSRVTSLADVYISYMPNGRASVSLTIEPDVIQVDTLTPEAKEERRLALQQSVNEQEAGEADE